MQQTHPFPRRRRYKLPAHEQQDTLLPFVSYLPERSYPHYWQMPAPDDDFAANVAYGRECAGHLLQWLKDNQPYAGGGLLSRIARDIDFDDIDGRGYWIGFFNLLEHALLLSALHLKVFPYVDHYHRTHEGRIWRRQLEERFGRKR